jgi:hypothetical protein
VYSKNFVKDSDEYDSPINEDLSVNVKLNSKTIELLDIRTSKRIHQLKVQAMLELRFPLIEINSLD